MKKVSLFGQYVGQGRKTIGYLFVFIVILFVAYVTGYVIDVFEESHFKTGYKLGNITMAAVSILGLLPLFRLYKSLVKGVIKIDYSGISFQGVQHRWADIQGLYTKYSHFVRHIHKGVDLSYRGSFNKLYFCLMIKSAQKDIEIAYLERTFHGTRSTHEENELLPFETNRFVELVIGQEPYLILLSKDDFLKLIEQLKLYTGTNIEELRS